MKAAILIVLTFFSGLNAFAAAAEKICKGIGGDEAIGIELQVRVNEKMISIKSKDTSYQGVYLANGGQGVFENSARYVEYEGQVDDTFYTLRCEASLLGVGTVGVLKIHAIAEGEYDGIFKCVDKLN